MKRAETKKELSPEARERLPKVLEARFTKHLNRHPGFEWAEVRERLDASPGNSARGLRASLRV